LQNQHAAVISHSDASVLIQPWKGWVYG